MLTKLSRSPHRNTFQKERYLANMAEQGKTAENSSNVAAMLDYFNLIDERHRSNEENDDWKKNNMEYDLCSTDWILEKVRSSDAYAQIAHRNTERVPIDQLEGRITTSLVTPYPPGIPLLIPGEVFNKTIIDYLKFAREFNEKFPGFETDIHGLVKEEVHGRKTYYVDCVKNT